MKDEKQKLKIYRMLKYTTTKGLINKNWTLPMATSTLMFDADVGML